MDMICVPREPDELRWAAIEPMKDVYRQAECILVVCRELAWLPSPSTPDEILVRIFRCKWMTRLWTLQEGALAQRLKFQFEDHPVDYNYLDDSMIAGLAGASRLSRLVGNRANRTLTGITGILTPKVSGRDEGQGAWSAFWTALRHRATPRRSDEAICASILLGNDPRPVLRASKEEKMKAFWREQKRIPSGILWVNGRRMTVDSLRWAPESLLDVRTWALSLPSGGPWTSRTDDGFVVQRVEGFWLRGLPHPDGENSLLEFGDKRTAASYYVYRMKNVGNAPWAQVREHWARVALLWREKPQPEAFSAGALISFQDFEDEVIRARWLVQVSVFPKAAASVVPILRERSEFVDGRIQHHAAPIVRSGSAGFIQSWRKWCTY